MPEYEPFLAAGPGDIARRIALLQQWGATWQMPLLRAVADRRICCRRGAAEAMP